MVKIVLTDLALGGMQLEDQNSGTVQSVLRTEEKYLLSYPQAPETAKQATSSAAC